MTQRSDLARVLDVWLADGPTQVPDHVFDEAVTRVYRTPQRSLWRLRWRYLKVSTRLLAAAIALAALGGIGILALSGMPGPTPQPTASSTPAPTATPSAAVASPTAGASVCQPSDSACTGELAPGTHSTSELLTPLRFTVADGWRKPLDAGGALNLEADGHPSAFLAVWPDWQIASQTRCNSDPEAGVGRNVDDIVAFLTAHPGLVATRPENVVLGGLPGVVLDIRLSGTATPPCEDGVNLFTHRGTINDVGWWDLTGDRVMRLWLLDGPDGHVTNVAIDAQNIEAFDAFVSIATPVIESIRFVRPTSCVDASPCSGELVAGSHMARVPLRLPFTYAVPEGWKNIFNAEHGYVLQPVDETAKGGGQGIYVFLDLQASNQSTCTRGPEPGVGGTASDLEAWLTALPDLSIRTPRDISLGGLSGRTYDISALSSGPVCPSPDYMLWYADAPGFWWGMTPGNPERHIVLDRPGGGTVFIIISAPEADFDEFVTAAEPIVQSFDFTP